MTRNWESCLRRISRVSDGQLVMRRASSDAAGVEGRKLDDCVPAEGEGGEGR